MEKEKSSDKLLATRINSLREKYLLNREKTLHRLVASLTVMLAWLLIWALVLKLGNELLLTRNYDNLKALTLEERIMWDIIPFNYRGTPEMKLEQFRDTVLNCFVFAPFGVLLCYLFKKRNIIRDVAICLGFSIFVELLQLVTMLGNPAPEDLLTNVIGYFIGLIFYHLVFKRISVKGCVTICAVANVICAVAVIFSLITTARSADIILKIITRTL